jgi:peptidoglycan-N-acetylglucosamine deacetylase
MQQRSHCVISNPVPWPNGARCAVAFTFDMDAESILHLAHHTSADTRVMALSMLRYGPKIAIPRILDMYRRYNLKQTFFVPSWCLERYEGVVESILRDGHEIGYHGYLHERPNELEAEQEEFWLRKGLEAFSRVTGTRPKGIRTPSFRFSRNTLQLLEGEGFDYDSSLMGDDIPYVLKQTSQGGIVELPLLDYSLDDWAHFMYSHDFNYKVSIKSPRDGMKVFREEFDSAWKHRGMWIAVMHPFLTGRLGRMDALEELLEYIMNRGDVWIAPLHEISSHVRSCIRDGSWSPRVDNFPYYDAPIPELGIKSKTLAS